MTSEMHRATWRGVDGRLCLRPELQRTSRPPDKDAAPPSATNEPAPATEQAPEGTDPPAIAERRRQRETKS
jgi:hypothetical protein